MMTLALTATEAKDLILPWIETGGAVVLAVVSTLALVLPKVAALRAQVETLFSLHSDNSRAIGTLALHTPPPPAPAATETTTPAAAAVAAALEENTEATRQNTAAAEASH